MSGTADIPVAQAPTADGVFAALARRAVRRLVLAEALRLGLALGPWLVAVVLGASLLALAGVHAGCWPLLALVAWPVVAVAVAWWRRPGAARALARWDAAAGRADGFLNAWDFERHGAAAPFAAAHLAAMRVQAVGAGERLARELPLGGRPMELGGALLAALLCVLLAVGGAWSPRAVEGADPLAAADTARFVAETAALTEEAKRLSELAGLATGEKTAAEDLAKKLAAAKAEAEAKGLTAHEALQAMDRLAGDAEKLAQTLADAPTASAALLDELAKHADTAALAEALRSGDLAKAAAAAEALAAKAADPTTSLEERRRLEEALKAATAAAEQAGDHGAVAKALGEARAALAQQGKPGEQQAKPGEQQGKPGEPGKPGDKPGAKPGDQTTAQKNGAQAGKALSSLAKSLGAAATRQQASKQVQRLAQRLRAGGGKVLAAGGAKPGGGNRPPSTSPVSNRPFTPNARPSLPTPGGRTASGAGKPGAGKPGSGAGSGNGGGDGNGDTPVPGSQPGGGGGGGAAGGGSAPTPVPGMSLARGGAGAGRGGNKAGRGHVARSMAPSAVRPTVDGGTVDAAQGAGDSTSHAVAGSEHGEDSALAASATPAALMEAEEKALDAEPLPLARREQVKRYFALLRASADAADSKDH